MKNKAVINTSYELVSIDKLSPHPLNPRLGKVDAVLQSIKANGFYGALVVQRSTGFILAGNHRFKAALQEGLQELPVIWVEVDDAKARKILIADNRTSDLGTYDNDLLAELLGDLAATEQLTGTGYDQIDLDVLLSTLEVDFNPIEAVTNLGSTKKSEKCRCPNCGQEFELGDAQKSKK